ncbi:ATP-binding cassette domain-containing protein [Sodalis sp. dw_96]|uniref:energy-coupling factor ABC transporter ATP-binding protein n=1 Tax=Sodalis sp. dw_96 TaxID=2719794 RepID=UPI001BD6AF5A|nr:ATP-binding cassette domain-containing protein [Sodalis sp. dw_96]
MDIIELSDVSFSYDGEHNALNRLDLTVGQGERVAILGPNGAGKSTLFQLFNGLLLPQSGRVVVDGLPVKRENFIELRRRVGMVFQDSDDQLFNATVYREIAYGLVNMKISGEELDNTIRWALNIVGMESYIHRNPFNLSGGEKKRIALASVIAMKPKVLVLDEPFNALDPRAASHLVHMLNDINKTLGITLIFTLHDMDIVPLMADKVYLMNEGEMVLGGTLAEFFNQKAILRRFDLRLPRVAHLAELLMRDGQLDDKGLPLTIGQAKEMIKAALEAK